MDKVLIVTGGGRGIGAATARLAGARGFKVAVNYHSNGDAAQTVVDSITQAGGTALAIQADVSTDAGVSHLFETVDQNLGTVDALFANAGTLTEYRPIQEATIEDLETIWRGNITSVFLCAREAAKRMSTKTGGKGGSIVINSSAAARIGGANGMLAYAASKGATDTFTLGLAIELGPQGIRVNAVRPGLIETTLHDQTGDLQRLEKLVGGVPMGRTGTAEEVAETVLWLLSDAASYVSGTHVDVSGAR
jgi:NAD(P)-dependent dehydrogenase (short-subunit alcohol dehydrogenase family)